MWPGGVPKFSKTSWWLLLCNLFVQKPGKNALIPNLFWGNLGDFKRRHCRDLGMTVLALDDLSGGFQANVPEAVTFIKGDIRDAEFLEEIFRQNEIHYVYHLAAYAAEGGEILTDLKTVHDSENLKGLKGYHSQ